MVSPDSDRVSRVRSYSGTSQSVVVFRLRGFHPVSPHFPESSAILVHPYLTGPTTPKSKDLGLGSSRFARRYFGNLFWFLFLCLLRCFSSASLAFTPYVFRCKWWVITPTGFPHSDISWSSPLPVLRSFSQVARPSSPIDAKASPSSSFLLDQKFDQLSFDIVSFTLTRLLKRLFHKITLSLDPVQI